MELYLHFLIRFHGCTRRILPFTLQCWYSNRVQELVNSMDPSPYEAGTRLAGQDIPDFDRAMEPGMSTEGRHWTSSLAG
jgi:hypothetical protein